MKTERIERVRAALRAQGLTQMIVCDPKSVWYLTGVAVEPYERLLALYLALYAVFRFLLEFLRGDAVRGSLGPLSTSQVISLAVLAGVLLAELLHHRRNIRQRP